MSDKEFGLVVKGSGGAAAAGDVRTVREEVERLKASAEGAGAAVDKLGNAVQKTGTVQVEHAQKTKQSTDEVKNQSTELERLMAALDSSTRAITQLTNSQDMATRALKSGQAALDMTDAAADRTTAALSSTTRQAAALGKEAADGNVGSMHKLFLLIAQSAGISAIALGVVVGAVALVAAGVAFMALAFIKGREEVKAMNLALEATSNFAGMTRSSMDAVAASVAAAGNLTIGTAKEITTSIVASGRYSAQNVAALSGLVDGYARSTGQSADKAAESLVKMFEDPVRASESLNAQYHYLGVAELERIKTLQATGQVQEAATLAIGAFNDHVAGYTKSVGLIERAWIAASKAVSSFWDSAKGIGRQDTTAEQLAAADAAVEVLRQKGQRGVGSGVNDERLKAAEALAAQLRVQFATEQDIAKTKGDAAQTTTRQLAAQKEIDKSATAQVQALVLQYELVSKNGVEGEDKQRRLKEINEQIEGLNRNMGAEGLAMADRRIEATLKLREMAIDMAQSANDAALKMKQVSQEEHDKTKTALDLQKNAVEQIAVTSRLDMASRTNGARQELEITLKRLKAEAEAIQFKGGLQQDVDSNEAAKAREAILNGMLDTINKVGDADLKRLNDSIAAQKLHNAEIGKTKDQIELVKAAAVDAATAKLESEAAAIDALLQEQDLDQKAIDIYTAIKVQLDAQIKARRELSALMTDGAAAQKSADALAQYQRDWDHANKEISRSITDSLMRGFEKGESAGKAFVTSLQAMFKTLILRPIIQFLVSPISGAITAAMSGIGLGGSAAGAAGAAGGGFNMLSGANTVSGWFGGPSIGPGSLGGMFAGLTTPGMSTSAIAGADIALGGLGGAEGAATLAAGGLEAGGALAGASGALAAMGPVGWVGLAALAAMTLFGGGGGPKASDAALRRRSDGSFGVEMNNVAGGDPDMTQVLALNAALNDRSRYDPAKLAGLVDTQVGTGSPADTASLLNLLSQSLQGAADSAQTLTAATAAQEQAEKDAAAALAGIQEKLDGFKATAASTANAVSKSLQDISEAYFAAQDDVADAQRRVNELTAQSSDSLRAFASTVKDFLQSLNTTDIGTATAASRYAALKSELSTTAAAALADPAMQAKLTDVAQRYLESSKAVAPDRLAFARDEANVRMLLSGIEDTATATAGATSAAVDPMVVAQQDLAKAQQHLADIFEAVKATGASTDRSTLNIAGSVADLLTAFREAKAADDVAQADYLAAQNLTAGIEFTVADNLAGLRADLAAYNAATAINSAEAKYGAAKATSDALLAAQSRYVASIGGSVYAPEDIASNQAQQFSFSYSSQAQLDTFNSLGAAYGSAFSTARSLYEALPGHADGMPFIPRDDYAMRGHYGEAVIDAPAMAAFRKYGIPARTDTDNSDVVAAIAELRREMRAGNVAIASATGRTARIIDRWDGEGLLVRTDEDQPLTVEVTP